MDTRTKTFCVDDEIYIDSVPCEIYNVLETTRSASADRDEELSSFVVEGHHDHEAATRPCDQD